ncbi:MAG: hypothetical protein HEQ32_09475 [Vampirovibrio sp.]
MRLMSNVLPASLYPQQRQGASISAGARKDFETYLKQVTASRPNLYQQVVAHMREWFDKLETNPNSGLFVQVFQMPRCRQHEGGMPFLKVKPGTTIAFSPDRNFKIVKHLNESGTSFTEFKQMVKFGSNGKPIAMAKIGLKTHFETLEDLNTQIETITRLLEDTLALEKVAEGFNPKTDDLRLIKPSSKKS